MILITHDEIQLDAPGLFRPGPSMTADGCIINEGGQNIPDKPWRRLARLLAEKAYSRDIVLVVNEEGDWACVAGELYFSDGSTERYDERKAGIKAAVDILKPPKPPKPQKAPKKQQEGEE